MVHPRGFGLGGGLKQGHTGPIYIIVDDDEVCCFASEGEKYCWRFEGCTNGQTPAKNRGAARHLAGLVWEGGNGYISLDHGGAESTPPGGGGMTTLVEMRQYIEEKKA